MSNDATSILGADTVYCINHAQLDEALRLAERDADAAPRLQEVLRMVERSLTRNERAALAFVLIERLRASTE
jgi:hypothetical protein